MSDKKGQPNMAVELAKVQADVNAINQKAMEGIEGIKDSPPSAGHKKTPEDILRDMKAGVFTHTLGRPHTFKGKEYQEFSIDLGSMTGDDMIAIDREMAVLSEPAVNPALSREFQVRMLARATGLPVKLFTSLPIPEFNVITTRVQNFLLGAGFM